MTPEQWARLNHAASTFDCDLKDFRMVTLTMARGQFDELVIQHKSKPVQVVIHNDGSFEFEASR
jgi:hypothetical protein